MAKKTELQLAIARVDKVIQSDKLAIGAFIVGGLIVGVTLKNKFDSDSELKRLLIEQETEDRLESRRKNEGA